MNKYRWITDALGVTETEIQALRDNSKEPGACYDADEFFRLTRPRYPDTVISDGMVIGYDNEMAIRYLDKVIVNDQDYEVRFKGVVSVTV